MKKRYMMFTLLVFAFFLYSSSGAGAASSAPAQDSFRQALLIWRVFLTILAVWGMVVFGRAAWKFWKDYREDDEEEEDAEQAEENQPENQELWMDENK